MIGVKMLDSEEDKTWESGLEPITECPYFHDNKVILVSKEVVDMAELISREILGYEWLLYCDMEEDETSIMVHTCTIPKQKVSHASVDVERGMNLPVVIHSHHSMGVDNFSETDDEYVNSNHKVSLLWVNDRGLVRGVIKKRLPCGHIALVPTRKIMVYIPDDYDYDDVKKRVRKQIRNIKKETYTYTYPLGVHEPMDEVEREYRKIIGDYDYEDYWWERWHDEDEEEEEKTELWKEK